MARRAEMRFWRYWLYPIAFFWLLWLYWISSVFTMGYVNPFSKKLAILIVGAVLPVLLWSTGTRDGAITGIILALLTWVPIAMLLIHG
jgi:hypothetical protein